MNINELDWNAFTMFDNANSFTFLISKPGLYSMIYSSKNS